MQSPVGLGAILSQKQQDGSFKPIAYGSRALTDTKTRYSQTEREALAVLWSCQHFHHYVFDRHITIWTDHKSLIKLLTHKATAPPHIMRWILHLQAYDYTLTYIAGSDNAADFLSRYVTNALTERSTANDTESFINMLIDHAVPKDLTLSDIITATHEDDTLVKVQNNINSDKWTKEKNTARYYTLRTQLSVKDDIIMKDNQIVIPSSLQHRAIEIAHAFHQGINKTIALLREKVWWPGMSKQV